MGGATQIVRFSLICMSVILIFSGREASAQGGIVCRYGTTKYRNCCRESYRNNPDLGARARAEDIDACMEGSSARQSSRPDEERARDDDDVDDEARGKSKTPPPKWHTPIPTTSGEAFRRLDCSTGACTAGCTENEMAISAFCTAGSTPAMYNDGSILCTNASGANEWPTVIICGRK